MSLTLRLVLLALCALVGLTAAGLAVWDARAASREAREEAALAGAESLLAPLLRGRERLDEAELLALTKEGQLPESLRQELLSLLEPLQDASAGYCAADGRLLAYSLVSRPLDGISTPPGPPPGPPPGASFAPPRGAPPEFGASGLLPLDAAFVEAACRDHSGAVSSQRLVAPNDLLFIRVAGGHEPFAAFALVRVPRSAMVKTSSREIVLALVIAVSIGLIVGLSLTTVAVLRRGVGDLGSAIVSVQADLATAIPQPATRELASLADGLRSMTTHLLEARERELGLERRLSHERRLASLGRVSAGLAHEIRNPLAGVKLRLDAMSRRALDARSERDVERALREIERLDSVIASLLLFARKGLGETAELELGAWVDERLATVDAFAATRGITLQRVGEGRADLDATTLMRALDNLVRNAIEASPPGGTVRVEIEGNGEAVELRVVDCGKGVPVDRADELFEPFFTSKANGTGLGLALARAAVEAHGGTLRYLRSEDKTVFAITLPGRARQ